jgi:8-oxo-dGTP pyrophosphatase MutT (NUDIX family)
MSTEGTATEFSAGGVVVRGAEVAVIVPHRRGPRGERVLALPKGHPERGESALETAVREVREEAGVTGRLIGSLGSIQYSYERRGRVIPKRVEFFLFEYESGDLQDHDHEIEEARWMPLAEAAVSLTHEGEREILFRAMTKRPGDL